MFLDDFIIQFFEENIQLKQIGAEKKEKNWSKIDDENLLRCFENCCFKGCKDGLWGRGMEQSWEHLPRLPGLDSQTRRRIWVEFVCPNSSAIWIDLNPVL